MAIHIDVETQDTHELRTLRWRNKQLGKQLGKAGAKIHELRCALAEVREINGKIGRNHVRNLERQVANDTQTIVELRIELEKMRERIGGLVDEKHELRQRIVRYERQHVVDDARA